MKSFFQNAVTVGNDVMEIVGYVVREFRDFIRETDGGQLKKE
jgi:hypothetical protein